MTTPESRSHELILSDLIDYAAAYNPMSDKGQQDHGQVLNAARKWLNEMSVKSALASSETARVDNFILSKAEEMRSLLERIAKANVIFPSMCANNMEAWKITDDLKAYLLTGAERGQSK